MLSSGVMNRTNLIAVAIATGLAFAAAGCSKDKDSNKQKAPSGSTKVADKTGTKTPAAQPAAKTKPATTPKATPPPAKQTGCAALFATATGKLAMDKISCIESTMENRGHKFDSGPCNKLENAWPVGIGDFAGLWPACQKAESFDDAACTAVLHKCF